MGGRISSTLNPGPGHRSPNIERRGFGDPWEVGFGESDHLLYFEAKDGDITDHAAKSGNRMCNGHNGSVSVSIGLIVAKECCIGC